MNKFAETFKYFLNEKKISRKKLANVLSISLRALYHWEAGDSECDFDMLIRIANIFEVSVGQLLGVEDY